MHKIHTLFTVLLIALVGILYYVLLSTDIASQKVYSETIKQGQAEYQYTPPVALITYAAGQEIFLSNQITLAKSALNKGIQQIYMYGKQNIDPEFYATNKKTLEYSKGAGYWLWKPYFVLQTMQKLPDDAIIIYADSGVIFSSPPAKNLIPLLADSDIIVPVYGKPVPLLAHVKKEAQKILDIENDPVIRDAQAIWASYFVLRNNEYTRGIVKKWLLMCEQHDVLTDFPMDSTIQDAIYETHLHDQALLGVVLAQNPERVKFIRRPVFRKKLGIDNFHRQPNARYTSPKFHEAGLNKNLAELLYNNALLRTIREYMYD